MRRPLRNEPHVGHKYYGWHFHLQLNSFTFKVQAGIEPMSFTCNATYTSFKLTFFDHFFQLGKSLIANLIAKDDTLRENALFAVGALSKQVKLAIFKLFSIDIKIYIANQHHFCWLLTIQFRNFSKILIERYNQIRLD